MYLIIGLGNPGEEYENTFHNLGRISAMKVQKEATLRDFELNEKFQSLVTEGKIKKENVAVALPETFMNKSGKAADALVKSYKVKPENIIVLHDDADITLGKIKMVKNRNSGGHKGVESIMRALTTKDFVRVRVGTTKSISKKGIWRDRDLMNQVVKKIPASQKTLAAKGVRLASAAALMTVEKGLGKAMSEYNRA